MMKVFKCKKKTVKSSSVIISNIHDYGFVIVNDEMISDCWFDHLILWHIDVMIVTYT